MKRFRYVAVSLVFLGLMVEGRSEERGNETLLREWISTKRQVTVKELGGNLSISGEVRGEFQVTREIKNGISQRGAGTLPTGGVPKLAVNVPNLDFDVEAVLLLDYRGERGWSSVKLKFDNSAGVISGTKDKIVLDRAYIGGRLVEKDTYTIDLEVGRRRLSNVFDSKIEFDALFDGILFKYDQSIDYVGDLYFHGGPFVVNEHVDQFAYVGEIGILNIADTGLYSKYSLIDWDTKDFPDLSTRRRFRFINSQIVFGYKWTPKKINNLINLYAAGLYNHAARRVSIINYQKANYAWYAGITIGESKKKGDWSVDVNYQWVAPQAVPDYDSGGIKRGNAAKVGTYTLNIDGSIKDGPTTQATTVGGANFKGWKAEGMYLFTNNLSFLASWQQSITQNHSVGPAMSYRQFEAELIYAF